MLKTLAAVALLFLTLPAGLAAQINSASLGGIVSDSSGASVPRVTVTATNTRTGIVTTVVSNELGIYEFPSLQTETYKVRAVSAGFETQIYDITLDVSVRARLDFTLKVAPASRSLDVTTAATGRPLATSSSPVEIVIDDHQLRDLPLPVRDVIGFLGYQAGVQCDGSGTCSNFAGGRPDEVNTTRDGFNVSDGKLELGAWSTTYTSPDLVQAVRVIVAPVDAEMSRGSGQVQMVTRSGTNQFRGSIFWDNLNSTLASNDWFSNANGVQKNYVNRNQYGVRLGGPITKNRTFFFALVEGQRYTERESILGLTLTAQARQGLFRFFPSVDSGNVTAAIPVVDRLGNPVRPANATGDLQTINLFSLDPNRTGVDQSPYMQETMARMPLPNEFTTGDGLNTAGIRFVEKIKGFDLQNGNGSNVDRDQYNLRLDHNFTAKHKLSVVGTKEHDWGDSIPAGIRAWPSGYDGLEVRRPDLYTLSFVSAFSGNLVNEFRAGRKRSITLQWGSADRSDAIGMEARKYLPVVNGIPFQVNPGGSTTPWVPFVSKGGFGRWREWISPMDTYAENLSWAHGKHTFKAGVEYRHTESNGFNDIDFTPRVTLGNGIFAPTGINGSSGMTGNTQTAARDLLNNLSASIGAINESFGLISAKDLHYYPTPIVPNNRRWWHQLESSAFLKDDWKLRRNLSLNLGLHWEWYGPIYENSGLASAVVVPEGKTVSDALCGVQCGAGLTTLQFVGKNSTHPQTPSNKNDWNNFAPAVGLSWSLPWWGQDKTVFRAGYGISFEGAARNFLLVDSTLGTAATLSNTTPTCGCGVSYTPTLFTTLSTLQTRNYIPIPGAELNLPTQALQPIPVSAAPSQSVSAYDRVSPYTQNWSLEVQREVAKDAAVGIRYIGTKSTKLWDGIPLNSLDIFNNGLLEAFNITRAGGSSELFNQMLKGINIGAGATIVDGTTETGSMALRQNVTTRTYIANGNVGSLTDYLTNSAAGTGRVGGLLTTNGFSYNFTRLNAQFVNVTLQGNPGNSTYHSLQTEFTKRLSNGLSMLATYTWSKALGENELDTFRDPRNRSIDKTLLTFDHRHVITSNGTWELPLGPGRSYAANATGWLARIVERWQLGGMMNWGSGAPLTITAPVSTIYNSTTNMTPDIASSFPKSTGKITKLSNGVSYFTGLQQVTDPYKSQVSPNDMTAQSSFSNKAIADANGNVLLVNPQPGTVGSLGRNWIEGPRSLNFDMNVIKRVKVAEAKEFEFRVDAINVLNHTNFGPPQVNIDSPNNDFGRIVATSSTTVAGTGQTVAGLAGARQFIVNARLNF